MRSAQILKRGLSKLRQDSNSGGSEVRQRALKFIFADVYPNFQLHCSFQCGISYQYQFNQQELAPQTAYKALMVGAY
jgi:hypothetical protein